MAGGQGLLSNFIYQYVEAYNRSEHNQPARLRSLFNNAPLKLEIFSYIKLLDNSSNSSGKVPNRQRIGPAAIQSCLECIKNFDFLLPLNRI